MSKKVRKSSLDTFLYLDPHQKLMVSNRGILHPSFVEIHSVVFVQ